VLPAVSRILNETSLSLGQVRAEFGERVIHVGPSQGIHNALTGPLPARGRPDEADANYSYPSVAKL
jgi:hypothetical protein